MCAPGCALDVKLLWTMPLLYALLLLRKKALLLVDSPHMALFNWFAFAYIRIVKIWENKHKILANYANYWKPIKFIDKGKVILVGYGWLHCWLREFYYMLTGLADGAQPCYCLARKALPHSTLSVRLYIEKMEEKITKLYAQLCWLLIANKTHLWKQLKEFTDSFGVCFMAVSYTHLTLPTIYSV